MTGWKGCKIQPIDNNRNNLSHLSHASEVPYAYWPKIHRDYKTGTHTPLCYRTSGATSAQGFRRTITSQKKIIKKLHIVPCLWWFHKTCGIIIPHKRLYYEINKRQSNYRGSHTFWTQLAGHPMPRKDTSGHQVPERRLQAQWPLQTPRGTIDRCSDSRGLTAHLRG